MRDKNNVVNNLCSILITTYISLKSNIYFLRVRWVCVAPMMKKNQYCCCVLLGISLFFLSAICSQRLYAIIFAFVLTRIDELKWRKFNTFHTFLLLNTNCVLFVGNFLFRKLNDSNGSLNQFIVQFEPFRCAHTHWSCSR